MISDSNSVVSSSSSTNLIDQRLWRAIDFLEIFVMIFSISTSILLGFARSELYEQCPLYARVFFRINVTDLTNDAFDRRTAWPTTSICELTSFAYLSSFVLSFLSLWIHVAFRRVLRTERLLRFPIGLATLAFAVFTLVITSILTDGLIDLCTNSEPQLCQTSGPLIFRRTRWKLLSLPVGGWLTTLFLILNLIARGIQLFSKPKKSPETLKALLNQLNAYRQLGRLEKQSRNNDSQSSSSSSLSQTSSKNLIDSSRYSSMEGRNPSGFYPPVPEYRQIRKESRCRRICCPCFSRRRSSREISRQIILPDTYFHPTTIGQRNSPVNVNLCDQHQVKSSSSVERSSQTENVEETVFPGRRRSSVRFEDEIPAEEETKTDDQSFNLHRNVSFRNNEDDLWTTVTINSCEPSSLIQSSHFNRLAIENSIPTGPIVENGVTAIKIINEPVEQVEVIPEPIEPEEIFIEKNIEIEKIKPIEEIRTLLTNRYDYKEVSTALKSNVARLKQNFSLTIESDATNLQQTRKFRFNEKSTEC